MSLSVKAQKPSMCFQRDVLDSMVRYRIIFQCLLIFRWQFFWEPRVEFPKKTGRVTARQEQCHPLQQRNGGAKKTHFENRTSALYPTYIVRFYFDFIFMFKCGIVDGENKNSTKTPDQGTLYQNPPPKKRCGYLRC